MKYEYLGSEGHGKILYHSLKSKAIRIADSDGNIDYIHSDGFSEIDAVLDYFKNWKLANYRKDCTPILTGKNGIYHIQRPENTGAVLQELSSEEYGWDYSDVVDFITD